MREGNELEYTYSTENEINYELPRLIYDELLTPNFEKNTLDSLYEKFNIYSPENVKDLGWVDDIDTSLGEIQTIAKIMLLNVRLTCINTLTDHDLMEPNTFMKENSPHHIPNC